MNISCFGRNIDFKVPAIYIGEFNTGEVEGDTFLKMDRFTKVHFDTEKALITYLSYFVFKGSSADKVKWQDYKFGQILAEHGTTGDPVHAKPVLVQVIGEHCYSGRVRGLYVWPEKRMQRWIYRLPANWQHSDNPFSGFSQFRTNRQISSIYKKIYINNFFYYSFTNIFIKTF